MIFCVFVSLVYIGVISSRGDSFVIFRSTFTHDEYLLLSFLIIGSACLSASSESFLFHSFHRSFWPPHRQNRIICENVKFVKLVLNNDILQNLYCLVLTILVDLRGNEIFQCT